MKFKKIILILIIFLITGCNANYTLTLKEDAKVHENVVIKVPVSDEAYKDANRVINKASNNKLVSKKDFDVVREDAFVRIEYNKDYDNIEEYLLKSFMYKQVFDEIDYTKKTSSIALDAESSFVSNNFSLNSDNIYDFDYLKINVISNMPVLADNADKVTNNRYSWIYNKQEKNKNISFKYRTIPTIISIRSIITLSLIIFVIVFISIIAKKTINKSNRI